MCKMLKFEELSEKAKKHVLEDEVKAQWEDGLLNESINDLFHVRLTELGFPNDDVRWSLGNSQGDGMAFYGRLEIVEFLDKNKLDLPLIRAAAESGSLGIKIKKNMDFHRYDHWNTMRVDVEDYNGEDIGLTEFLTDVLVPMIKNVSHELEGAGYKLIEDETSDENVTRNLNEEYRYHANGDLCPDWADGGDV